jgi:hypothetical protein
VDTRTSPHRSQASRGAVAALALAVLASGLLLLHLDSSLTFVADDWELLVVRDGWSPSAFLEPFNENVVIGPALVYKLLLAAFGMDSALPFYVVSIGAFLASAVLLFVYLRRRVGDWLAVVAAFSILFLGAAFEDLLWAFQVGYFASMAAGIGMLLALDRDDERGDALAATLLGASLAFSSLGLAFALGALVAVAAGDRPRARRSYLVVLPLALFWLWWLGWGHAAESHVSVDNALDLPRYVFDAAAAGVVSLLGLATGNGGEPDQPHLIWGQLLVPVLAAGVALRVLRDRGLSRGLAVALAVALGFWVLAGLNRNDERFPTSSRYQYPSAVFLWLVAAEALRGLRVPRSAVAIAAVVAAIGAVGGVSLMRDKHEERWEPVAGSIRSSLAAVELAGPAAQGDFPVSFPPKVVVPAAEYLAVAREHGSPAFDETELAARPEPERAAADLTMAQAIGLALVPPPRGRQALDCQPLSASAGGDTGQALPPGDFRIANAGPAPFDLKLRRFADALSVSLGPVPPGVTTSLSIPPDRARRPWRLGLVGAGPVRLCALGRPGGG